LEWTFFVDGPIIYVEQILIIHLSSTINTLCTGSKADATGRPLTHISGSIQCTFTYNFVSKGIY